MGPMQSRKQGQSQKPMVIQKRLYSASGLWEIAKKQIKIQKGCQEQVKR